jgi:hypothetical protein
MDSLGCGERPPKRGKAMQARDDAARALLDRQTMAILIEGMVATQGRAALNRIIDAGRQVLNLPSMEQVLREEQLAAAAAAEAEAAALRSDNVQLTGTVHCVKLGVLRVFTNDGKKGKVIGWAPDAGQELPADSSGEPTFTGSGPGPAGPHGKFLVKWSKSAPGMRATFADDWSPISVEELYALHWHRPPAAGKDKGPSNWTAPVFSSVIETCQAEERHNPERVVAGTKLLILPVTKALRQSVKLLFARRYTHHYCDLKVQRDGSVSLCNVKFDWDSGDEVRWPGGAREGVGVYGETGVFCVCVRVCVCR